MATYINVVSDEDGLVSRAKLLSAANRLQDVDQRRQDEVKKEGEKEEEEEAQGLPVKRYERPNLIAHRHPRGGPGPVIWIVESTQPIVTAIGNAIIKGGVLTHIESGRSRNIGKGQHVSIGSLDGTTWVTVSVSAQSAPPPTDGWSLAGINGSQRYGRQSGALFGQQATGLSWFVLPIDEKASIVVVLTMSYATSGKVTGTWYHKDDSSVGTWTEAPFGSSGFSYTEDIQQDTHVYLVGESKIRKLGIPSGIQAAASLYNPAPAAPVAKTYSLSTTTHNYSATPVPASPGRPALSNGLVYDCIDVGNFRPVTPDIYAGLNTAINFTPESLLSDFNHLTNGGDVLTGNATAEAYLRAVQYEGDGKPGPVQRFYTDVLKTERFLTHRWLKPNGYPDSSDLAGMAQPPVGTKTLGTGRKSISAVVPDSDYNVDNAYMVGTWNWNDRDYCVRQLKALGFSDSDLVP